MFLTFKRTICIGTILKRTLTTDTTNQELTEVLKKINDLRKIIFKKKEMKRSLSELGPKQPINIQILSTGYLNDSKSFLISSYDRSYMINCGESMSRFMNSERKNILKIEHLFLTRVNWNTLGGLYSTTFDKKSLKMHSAFNFKNEFKNAKCIFDRTCQMSQHDYNKSFEFEDDIIKVTPIHQSIEESSYLFTVKQTVPKILTHKLNEYNLKPGPWIKDIQNGKDYTSPDGQLIKASELVDNISCEEKQILVIDCINESTFQNTIIHKIDQLQLNNKKAFILHLSDISLQKSESYKNWMNSLNDCVHIIFDETKPTIDILRLYELQVQLHLVNEFLFPLLQLEKNLTECEYNNKQFILAKTNMIINIRPCFEIDCEKVIDKIDYKNFKLSNSLYNYLEMKNSINDSETNKILNEFKHKLENYQEKETQYSQSLNNGIYPKVLLLGTSSAVATVYRNVSSTLFLLNESKYFLLDCGESTWIQMKRFFPSNSFNNKICKVKAVFISHAHYDHHNGLYGFVMKRAQAFKQLNLTYEPLILMFPRYLMKNFFSIEQICNQGFFDLVKLVPNELFHSVYYGNDKFLDEKRLDIKQPYLAKEFTSNDRVELISQVKNKLDLNHLEVIRVAHIPYSYCLYMITNKNVKLAYSGDCRPNNNLIETAKNCDFLVHECTFDDTFMERAISEKHTAQSEAFNLAKSMNARTTILNHFSPRYGIYPNFNNEIKSNIIFGFDFMLVDSENAKYLNDDKLEKTLKILFQEKIETNLIKTNARWQKKLHEAEENNSTS